MEEETKEAWKMEKRKKGREGKLDES